MFSPVNASAARHNNFAPLRRLRALISALVWLSVGAGMHSPSVAGPTDTDVEPPAKGAAATSAGSRSSRADGNPGNAVNSGGTLDVLIDLQGKSSVGLEFREKAKAAAGGDKALAGADAVPTTGGLYGSGAAPAATAQRKTSNDEFKPVADQRVDPNAPVVSDSAKRAIALPDTGDAEPGLAARLMAWVREYRAVVILLGVLLLGLVGAVSMGGAAGRKGR
jgi:hypothetical protein